MKAGVTQQRIAASISAVNMVASVSLIIANPNKGVSDPVSMTDAVTANIIAPYFAAGYITDGYCQDSRTVTA